MRVCRLDYWEKDSQHGLHIANAGTLSPGSSDLSTVYAIEYSVLIYDLIPNPSS